jgi:hypothetical protein
MHLHKPRSDLISIPSRQSASEPEYVFTVAELETLCRWYSALKYAFPEANAFMVVSHKDRYSIVGISNINRRASPTGMLFKHIEGGRAAFSWLTEADTTSGPTESLNEITDPHIAVVACPADEATWLDRAGWLTILSERTIDESP